MIIFEMGNEMYFLIIIIIIIMIIRCIWYIIARGTKALLSATVNVVKIDWLFLKITVGQWTADVVGSFLRNSIQKMARYPPLGAGTRIMNS